MKRIQIATAVLLGIATAQAAAQPYSRTEEIRYHDNTTSWVIGQVERTVVDGIEESKATFNAAAQPITSSAFGKLQQTYGWNADGNLASVSDGRDTASFNTTVLYSGWKRGIPQTVTFPDGYTRKAVVDDAGWISKATDENGYVTCYGYDGMGRLNKITYPNTALVSGAETCGTDAWNSWDRTFIPVAAAEVGLAAGHWREQITTGNMRTFVYYDALWRPVLTQTYDAANYGGTLSQSVTRYDSNGQPIFQSYPQTGITDFNQSLKGTRTTYDALGRQTRVEQDAEAELGGTVATTTAYLGGFQTRVTNPRGKVTTTSFKTFDQPNSDWPVSIAHPMGVTTTIARDAFGKPTAIARFGGAPQIAATRVYEYNANQELCRRTEPETGSTLMGYDAAGNLAWTASGASSSATCAAPGNIAARTSTRTYDKRNRLIDLSFGDDIGEQVWTYTPDGLAKTITTYNGAGRTLPYVNAYSYNKRRMLGGQGETGQDTTYGGTGYTWTIGYGYDRNGAVANNSYPSGQVVDYAPNALGQATRVGPYATGVSYHPNGGIRQFTYGNGVIHEMTQNARRLPERSRDYHGSTTFLDDSYDYDANSNVLAISDGVAGNRGNRDMTYDDLDRLTSTASPMYGGTIRYTYDALDNLQSVARPNGQSYRYCYNVTWQLAFLRHGATTACNAGSAAFALTYDAQGNLYQKNDQRYTFTQDNRLRNVANKESYRYDGHGRRTLSYAPSRGNTLFLYGNDGVLRYMKDNGRARQEDYFYLAGTLVAIRETAGTTTTIKYQHTDALGSPAVVTNAARGVVERSEREPYGKLVNRAMRDGVGFTGHVEDALTGLVHMQQRYMDPDGVVFLSVDPMTVDPTTAWNFNRYNYAAANPYKFKDPDGRAIDLIADIGFIGYSGYVLATQPSWTNAAALGADVIGAAVPFATGLGAGVRAAAHADEVADVAKGLSRQALGAAREQAVAKLTGGAVSGEMIAAKGLGKTDIDVVSKTGDLIAVGGPAKAGNLGNLGRSLRIYAAEANVRGVGAKAYFEKGTPEQAIKLAQKILGEDNVRVFSK